MLKRRSLSTEDGGEHNIFVSDLSKFENYAAISFPSVKRIHFSRFEWKMAKFAQLYFQSVLMMISEHIYFLKFVFLHFSLLMLHLMTNHRSKSQSRTC